jgi:mannose-1-phosphate guanylyltransferase/mannose-6-phosphate isomerase
MSANENQIVPVILSGGSGSRLWPLSRALRPKQFLGLTDELTLFQLTLERLRGLVEPLRPIVVANDDHRFLVAEQCLEHGVTPSALILEPIARNTAPAIAVAALAASALAGPESAIADPVLLVLPSDHVFKNNHAFQQAVRVGEQAALAGAMVTFGIVPTAPETGYGYVKASTNSGAAHVTPGSKAVAAFVEKPDADTAKQYLASGDYFWNSGMFMFRASTYLAELKTHNPSMFNACEQALHLAKKDLDFVRLDKDAFAKSPSDSIDYAVMEKTTKAVVVPLDAGWSDVGAWSAVWEVLPQDASGNATRGDVLVEGSKNCYVHADYRLVSLLGVEDVVVVETSDAVLVAHKDKAQDVKKLVDRLKADGRNEVQMHREVFRPWGSYDSIDNGTRYQVKRITVKPGAKLSLQMHHHRAEHWVVVSGTAKVRLGEKQVLLSENQSIYIPIGEVHSLENPGKVDLELIEVQSGSYLGEDDIVRLEDKYGRT